jgi:hypothetical protein
VRHRGVAEGEERVPTGSPAAITRAATRGRVRVLMKAYSTLALLWVLPTALLLNTIEAIGLLFGRQRGRARGIVGGWFANLRDIRDVRRARRGVQALRRVDDSDVRDLMVRGSARVRTLVTQRMHAGDRLQDVSNRTRTAMGRARLSLRHPGPLIAVVVAVVIALGSRNLLFGRVPEVGAFSDWPGVGDLVRTFTSPWQRPGLGVETHATPAFAFMAALSTLLLGDTDLARTLMVVGAIPLAAWGVFRATRPLAHSALPALAAAVAYVVNPLPRNAIAQGRLGSLVMYALAPFLLAQLLRAAGTGPIGDNDSYGYGGTVRRAILAGAIVTAFVTAFFPAGLLFAAAVAIALVIAVPLVGGTRASGRVAVTAAAITIVSAVLLVPWTFTWFELDGASLGFVARDAFSAGEILRFATGPAGAGWAPWGLLVAAALPLLVATGSRLAWAGRAWMLVVVSYALAWVPGRIDASLARPEPEGVLVGAALGIAIATGLGVAAFADDLRTFLFGWRQLAAVAATFGILLPVVGLIADSVGGRWRLPSRDWPDAVAWMADEQRGGDFRVLWIGDPDVLPVAARSAGDTTYGLSRNGPGDVRNAFQAPPGRGEPVLGDALELLTNQQTARFGHLVAPMGVRYVAVVRRAAPEGGVSRHENAAARTSLGEQLDLAVVQAEPDMMLYENQAWAPIRAVVPAETDVDAPDGDAIEASLRAELQGAAPVTGEPSASRVPRAGTLLFGEAYSERWRASLDGEELAHRVAFGWANAFDTPEPGTVDLDFDEGFGRRLLLLLQALLWVAAVGVWIAWRRAEPGTEVRA